jgi:alpha-beta hydrolase superfamily lysophospholipase
VPRPVDTAEYLAFLPPHWRERALAVGEPQSTWWRWRDMRVHILSLPRPQARARLLVLHGAGGHSGALWPLAALADAAGYEAFAPDLPGYGLTEVPDPAGLIYPDWVDCVTHLLRAQSAADPRPLVVLGGSMGGLLGYSACARVRSAVSHLVVTCLLDPSNPVCWPALSRWGGAASVRLLRPLMSGLTGGRGPARWRVPMRWVAPMHAIAHDPALARLCAQDARGGGSRVPLGFLASYLFSQPEVAPQEFREVPVTLIHPTDDRWTPPEMSLAFLRHIAAPVRHVPLEGCGHFPVEEPGLTRAVEVLREVLEQVARRDGGEEGWPRSIDTTLG